VLFRSYVPVLYGAGISFREKEYYQCMKVENHIFLSRDSHSFHRMQGL